MKAAKPARIKFIAIAFLAIFGATLITPFIHPQKAVADSPTITNACLTAGKFKWLDRAHIEATFCTTTVIFFDQDIDDTAFRYRAYGYETCGSESSNYIDIKEQISNGQQVMLAPSTGSPIENFSFSVKGTATGSQCKDIGDPTSKIVANPGFASNIFYAKTTGGIERVDGDSDWSFVTATGAGNFIRENEQTKPCPDMIHIAGSRFELYEITTPGNGSGPTLPGSDPAKTAEFGKLDTLLLGLDKTNHCRYDVALNKYHSNAGGAGLYANTTYPLGTAGTAGVSIGKDNLGAGGNGGVNGGTVGNGGGGINFDCEVKWYNPLTWIICPAIELLQGFINWFDQEIDNMLRIPSNFIDNSCSAPSCVTGKAFFGAWSSVRTIALVILLIIGLVMVISQAISVGPFDAYTVKKVLPRLLVAVIGVALSWNLMVIAIRMTNGFGVVVRGIIQYPFQGLPLPTLGQGTTGVFAVGVGIAFLATSLLATLSFLATAALAVFIGYVVLILRQIIVMLLVMIAPLGIVMYILPNTQKAWKLWWESFSKALLMFPMIVAFIAAGRVFARAAYSLDPNAVPNQIIAFIAYFLPYFLLPATVRLAGGALSTVGGFVNDRGKGGFDRLKGFRGEQRKLTMQKNLSGNRFGGGKTDLETGRGISQSRVLGRIPVLNRLNRGSVNRGLSNLTMAPGAIAAGGLVAGARDLRGQIGATRRNQILQETQEVQKDQAFQTLTGDERNIDAIMRGTSRQNIRDRLAAAGHDEDEAGFNELVLAIEQLQRAHGGQALGAAALLQRATGKNAFNDPGQMEYEAAQTSGGDMLLAQNLLGPMRQAQTQAGRHDNVTSFGEQVGLIGDIIRGTHQDDGTAVTPESIGRRRRQGALRTTGSGQILSGTTLEANNMFNTLEEQFREALRDGDQELATDLAGRAVSLRQSVGGATPEVRNALIGPGGLFERMGLDDTADQSVDEQLGTVLATHFDHAPIVDDREAAQRINAARTEANYQSMATGTTVAPVYDPADVALVDAANAARRQAEIRTNAVRARAGSYDAGTRGDPRYRGERGDLPPP